MNRSFKIVLIESGDAGTLYSIQFKGESKTELEKFLENERFKGSDDLDEIAVLLNEMAMSYGFLETYFKIKDGKRRDSLVALSQGRIRLYCLRLLDVLLIVGNGGLKTRRTYQQDPSLNNTVTTLQEIDNLISERLISGKIRINRDTGLLTGSLDFSIGDIS